MTWQIDPAHTRVEFRVKHMMVTHVRGSFDSFEGTVDFDDADPTATRVDVTIDASSINTHEPNRDGHLRSPDFFDVENYPTLTFASRRVEPVDDTHAKLIGDLTIRGITREVALDVEFVGSGKNPWGKTVAGFNAWARINRKDWNLTWNVGLETGGFLVGDDIAINIELELVKEPAAEAAAS